MNELLNLYGEIPFDVDSLSKDIAQYSAIGFKSAIGDVIIKLQNYFANRQTPISNFIECFTALDAIMPDDFSMEISDTRYRVANPVEDPERYEVCLLFLDSLGSMIYNASPDHTITVTDSEGYVYALRAIDRGENHYGIYNDHEHGAPHISFIIYNSDGSNDFVTYPFAVDFTKKHYITWYDLINDLVVNSELNDLYLSSLLAIGDVNDDQHSKLSNALSKYIYSDHDEVRNEANGVLNAFSTGGVIGVFNKITAALKALTSIQTDDDTLLKFVDNESLCPQAYISGILESAYSAVSAVASAIIAVASPILGIVSYLASNLIQRIIAQPKSAWENQTLLSIDEEANCPYFPFGFNQDTRTGNLVSSSSDSIVVKYGRKNIPFSYDFGPMHFLWSTTRDGVNGKTAVEGHIDCTDRRVMFYNWLSTFGSHNVDELLIPLKDSAYNNCITVLKNAILNGNHSVSHFENQPSNGVLSENDDRAMREIFATNFIIFYILLNGNKNRDHLLIKDLHGTVVYDYSINGFKTMTNAEGDRTFSVFGDVLFGLMKYMAADTNLFDRLCGWDNFALLTSVKYNAYPNTEPDQVLIRLVDEPAVILTQCDMFHVSRHAICSSLRYCAIIPKYDRWSFWLNVALFATLSTVAVTVGATLAFSARKAISNWAIKSSAKIEKAWNNFVANPTDANLQVYRKLAWKNNVLATIFGTTKYSKMGYWISGNAQSFGVGYVISKVFSAVRNKMGDNQMPKDYSATIITKIDATNENVTKVGKLISSDYQ